MTKLDTGTEDLLAEVDDGVAVLTMNRPDRRNAMSEPMMAAMERVLGEVEADDAVGCVVLTGAGGAFCAGGDVKAMSERPAADRGHTMDAAIHRQRLRQRATQRQAVADAEAHHRCDRRAGRRRRPVAGARLRPAVRG